MRISEDLFNRVTSALDAFHDLLQFQNEDEAAIREVNSLRAELRASNLTPVSAKAASDKELYARELAVVALCTYSPDSFTRDQGKIEIASWSNMKVFGYLKRSGYRYNTLHGRWEHT